MFYSMSHTLITHTCCARSEANFKHHPSSVTSSSKVKILRYQMNPTAYWGPGKKAGTGPATGKRKRDGEDE